MHKKTQSTKIVLKKNKWDSLFFGIDIADMFFHGFNLPSESEIKLLLDRALKKAYNFGFKYLVFTLPEKFIFLSSILKKQGFKLIDLCFDLKLVINKKIPFKISSDINIIKTCISDIPFIERIASYSFRLSRFYNLKFSNKKLSDLYHIIWIRNLLKSRRAILFTAKLEDRVCGFLALTLNRQDCSGRISLIATKKDMQGMGVGNALVYYAINWARKKRFKTIYVKTQKNNLKALKLYKKHNFKIFNVERKYSLYL
ncbi:MAG: GNAT family N-acetyltransferase [Patescibacteria group bacterium]